MRHSCGANQLIITTIGISFSLLIIVIYSGYLKKSKKNIEEKINAGIIIDENISDVQINAIISEIKKISEELRFISMSRSSENTTINVEFKNGKQVTYNHDKVYEIMKNTLNSLPCYIKYNSYTSSTNVPVSVRNVVEVLTPTV